MSTKAGPRSRTLASFRALSPEVIEKAQMRAAKPLVPAELRRVAVRAGAPLASSEPDRSARSLLASLATGGRPRPVLRRLLVAHLGVDGEPASDNAKAAGGWATATLEERGETLRDLLLLADRLPQRHRSDRRFPRIESSAA